MSLVDFISYGISKAELSSIIIYTLCMTHITIVAVTVFLHRCQAHRSLKLSPVISHFFRFWLWLTTGMVTKEWAQYIGNTMLNVRGRRSSQSAG